MKKNSNPICSPVIGHVRAKLVKKGSKSLWEFDCSTTKNRSSLWAFLPAWGGSGGSGGAWRARLGRSELHHDVHRRSGARLIREGDRAGGGRLSQRGTGDHPRRVVHPGGCNVRARQRGKPRQYRDHFG